MDMDLLDLYGRASDWTLAKVPRAAADLDGSTRNEGWDVRTLLNHILQTQLYFTDSAQGKDASPPSADPPELLGDADPVECVEAARNETMRVFGEEGVIERTGPALGIAFADLLLHGWDLAVATDQDATMPVGLPDAAYTMIHGRFTDEQRVGVFKPEIPVSDDASPQDRLLAYTGRDPAA